MAGIQKEHWKGATGLGNTRDHLEAGGGVSSQKSTLYRAVVQAVLLIRAETWVLSMAMEKRLSGVHTGFLQQVTRKGQRGVWMGPINRRGQILY